MSFDFYDNSGRAYAYSDDGETIYTYAGKPIAYISKNSIYGFNGRHLGYFENGYIWNPQGQAVLFTDGAIGGPMRPMKQLKPLKGLKALKPLKALTQLAPIKPLYTTRWANDNASSIFESA